jgi:SAM-dependent methyltransferase
MGYAVNRVLNLEDFEELVLREIIRDIFVGETSETPEFPTGREHRKQWEISMAVLALRSNGALRPNAEVLGIGAGSEPTLFWLTNHVRRVWATDLYAAPGVWSKEAPPTMLADPGRAWYGPWRPRRLVVQHMDACQLNYEDESFDGIFSSSSLEHFGSIDRISIAMDEACRVLKPGGTASFSTEFLLQGDPLQFEAEAVMFTPELIERVLIGEREWAPVTPLVNRVSDATLATEVDIEDYLANGGTTYPHCVLRIGPNLLTSVHIALRKPASPAAPPAPLTGRSAFSGLRSYATHSRSVAAPQRPQHAHRSVGTLSRMFAERRESAIKRAARRVARPLLSPIDGRVADINRRIENTRATAKQETAAVEERLKTVSGALEAYADSSSEASSYVGLELRRIHDVLDALQETTQGWLDEYYRMRMAHAAATSLEELDEPLAHAINYATSHRGFYAQADLWFNPPVSVRLAQGSALLSNVTERIVEVPFAMAALSRVELGARILDVGSAESTFPLSAASLGYSVTAIDPRPLPYTHPNLTSYAIRLEEWEVSAEPFDAVFLISTLEHVGVGAYRQPADPTLEHGASGDVAVLNRVRRLLKPEGLMVLTVPYGAREVTELERIYDDESLETLLAAWEVVDRRAAVRRNALVWEAAEHFEPGARGVVMLIASPRRSA